MKYLFALLSINGLSYLASIFLGNTLDPIVWGKIVSALTISGLITVLSTLGRVEYDLREVSQYGRKISLLSILISIVIATLLSFMFFLFIEIDSFFFLFSIVLSSLLISFACIPLKHANCFFQLALIQKIPNIFKIILMIVVLYSNTLSLQKTTIILLVLISIYLIFNAIKFNKYYSFILKRKGFERESIRFLINDISFVVYYQAGIFIMAFYKMFYAISVYSLAMLMLSGVGIIINGFFNSMSLSLFYKQYGENKKAAIYTIEVYSKWSILLSIPLTLLLCIIIFFVYPYIFNLIKYPELQKLSLLFMIPIIIKMVYAPYGLAMNLRELIKIKNKIFIFISSLCIVLTIVFLKYWGVYGAYVAFTVSEVILAFCFIFSFLKFKQKIIEN